MTESEASITPLSAPASLSSDIFLHPNDSDPNRSSSLSPFSAAPTPPSSPQHTTSSSASQDHTQHMSFTDYIEWYGAEGHTCHRSISTGGSNTSDTLSEEEGSQTTIGSTTESHMTEYDSNGVKVVWEDVGSVSGERSSGLGVVSDNESDHASESSTPEEINTVSALQSPRISNETRSIVRGLRIYARWTYIQLHHTFHLPLSTLYRIVHSTARPSGTLQRGRPPTISSEMQHQLIELATADAYHRRLPLTQIADLAGIRIGPRAVRRIFASHGYHRRIAHVKPFLSPAAKVKRRDWGERYCNWTIDDWQDVIWSDECALSVGQVHGNVWVTRRPGEEFLEDCLVPKFNRLATVMIWGAIYRDIKGPLVIWDMKSWGKINGPTYINRIIRPHLYPWYMSLHEAGKTNSGYIYFQQGGAAAHRSKHATQVFHELGMASYIFPWPPSSPDMSPIEGVWRLLKRRIQNRHPRPVTVPDLYAAIQEEWDSITSDEILNLTSSVPERVQELLLNHGSHTSW